MKKFDNNNIGDDDEDHLNFNFNGQEESANNISVAEPPILGAYPTEATTIVELKGAEEAVESIYLLVDESEREEEEKSERKIEKGDTRFNTMSKQLDLISDHSLEEGDGELREVRVEAGQVEGALPTSSNNGFWNFFFPTTRRNNRETTTSSTSSHHGLLNTHNNMDAGNNGRRRYSSDGEESLTTSSTSISGPHLLNQKDENIENNNHFDHNNGNGGGGGGGNGSNNNPWYKDKGLFFARIKYYIPILSWLPHYKLKEYLLSDLLSGLTVGFLLVPQSLSYASALAKLPPTAGLMTAIIPCFVYAILGTSRQLSVGPEAVVSLMTGSAVSNFILASMNDHEGMYPSTEDILAFSSTLALMVGFISFAMGLLRLGFIDGVFSKALLAGFIGAVAIVIEIEQLPILLGFNFEEQESLMEKMDYSTAAAESPIQKLFSLLYFIPKLTHIATLVISIFSVFFLALTKWLKHKLQSPSVKARFQHASLITAFIPGTITLVLGMTFCSWFWNWKATFDIQILQDVIDAYKTTSSSSTSSYGEGSTIRWPMSNISFLDVQEAFKAACLISIIGFIESVVAGKKYAAKFNYNISANRELVAFGVMNVVSSLFQAYPSFGSLSRTVVNSNSRSQMASIVTGFFLLAVHLFFIPLMGTLPAAVMSSIIFMAALELFEELKDLAFMWKIRAYMEIAYGIGAALCTLCVSVEAGVLLSMVWSVILVLKHSMYPRFTLLGQVDEEAVTTSTGVVVNHNEGGVEVVEKGFPMVEGESNNASSFHNHNHDLLMMSSPVTSPTLLAHHQIDNQGGLHNNNSNNNNSPQSPTHNHNSHINAQSPQVRKFKPLSEFPQARRLDRILIITLHEPLFFGNTSQLIARLQRLEMKGEVGMHPSEPSRLTHPVQHVIIDLENVVEIDASATKVLLDLARDYKSRNIGLYLVKCRNAVKPAFERSGLADLVGHDHFLRKVGEALRLVREYEENKGDD